MTIKKVSNEPIINEDDLQEILTPEILELSELFKKNGHSLRVVGGAVRDLVRGEIPKDIDLASDATPEEIQELLKDDYHVLDIGSGIEHGTVTVNIKGENYEITTLRIDKETDGRHAKTQSAKIAFPDASLEELWKLDAERRDLTFNALSLDIQTGKIYDYFGGIEDLQNKNVRFVGDSDKRIQEDYLRILRFFRFLGRTGGTLKDTETKESIKNNAEGLTQISVERIWSEFSKILTGKNLKNVLEAMNETMVSDYIGIDIQDISGAVRVNQLDGDPVTILCKLANPKNGYQATTRWKMSREEIALAKFLYDNVGEKLDAKEVLANSKLPDVTREHLVQYFLFNLEASKAKDIATWDVPKFPVTGKDLQDLGYKPGPMLGTILRSLRQEWSAKQFSPSKEELLSLAKSRF